MTEENEEKPKNFHEMEIDDRILKGIAKLGWQTPTLIQEQAIPLLLEGKDVLLSKQTTIHQEVKAIILAPSKELCSQICKVMKDLTIKCSREIRCIDISAQVDLAIQKPMLVEKPDIIVSTPARILQHAKASNLNVKQSLEMLVIDEADLIFSFGYENEVKELLPFFPKIYQAILASATLSEDVKNLKSLVLHNPVTLKLNEPDLAPSSQLTHYHLNAEEMDKASILYALLKLHLIRGKSIIFVNTVDKCYKIKLYLEQFGIKTCVLNSELPAKIRCHSVNQFNQGIYDIIIASDEKALENPGESQDNKTKKSKRRKDKESGVSRGIDFQCVANVINFDFPLDIESYIHRAGRTARGNNQGSVLSFVSIKEQELLKAVETHLQGKQSGSLFSSKTYQFKLEEVEAFRYRARDAWRAATKIAVREARLKEIKQEIFNCQKLKSFFEDNPNDLQVLRHDKALHTVKIQQHLADVPDYIIPPTLKNLSGITRKRKRTRHQFKTSESSNSKFQVSNQVNSINMC
ncbi:rna helicase [Holotrichia oblita]|uniref:Rna helicase n=1 Tax=Holotrichia oblita TaxID=644536 RepID=A0ACB9SUR1_HOLOL|nr:rna helicase [Holotrichia oblita]